MYQNYDQDYNFFQVEIEGHSCAVLAKKKGFSSVLHIRVQTFASHALSRTAIFLVENPAAKRSD